MNHATWFPLGASLTLADLEGDVHPVLRSTHGYSTGLPAATVIDRYAVQDVQLGAASIRAGELVRVSPTAANRDPDIFDQSDVFDPYRSKLRSHVTFALGSHVCLGFHRVSLEAQLALERAVVRLPRLQLAATVGAAQAARPRGLVFRKPQALQVVWQV